MMYGFDSDRIEEATAALLVYAVWRSRDRQRFKITPDVWAQVERFTKAAAKRSGSSIPQFLEKLKPKLACATLSPRAMEVGLSGTVPMVETSGGTFIQFGGDSADSEPQREFLTRVIQDVDQRTVINVLYKQTAWIILLVRDRLEREKPVERRVEQMVAESG